MKIAYADTFSGISGDMFLGALIDAGLPVDYLVSELARLPIHGFKLTASKTKQNSISASLLSIKIDNDHPHRSWKSIRRLLEESDLSAAVKNSSLAVFTALAAAEAAVHGCQPDEVHFHEVGAVDSIIDIVGSAIGLDYFGIEKLFSSPLPLTHGWVQCDHGSLPLPAPAVCELVKGLPVYGVNLAQEIVTPTGAAILKALAHSFGTFPPMTVEKVGYGSGSRELENGKPNLLRLVIGLHETVDESQEVDVIECHIDDMSPEFFPYLSERLFDLGALDVGLIPMQMKKGRTGFLLRAVASAHSSWDIKRCILSETSAIGLRFRTEQRMTLPRQAGTVSTSWGKVRVKKVKTPVGEKIYPEYEDCRQIARTQKIPLSDVYTEVNRKKADDFQVID